MQLEKNIPSIKERAWRTWRNIVYYKYIYLLLLPGLLFFVVFKYVPMYGIQLAFKEFYINKGIMGSPWVGMEHFQRLMAEPEFIRAFNNTVIISLLKVVIAFPLPIVLAMFINEVVSVKFKKTLQTVYTFPHFLSWVIVAGICGNILSSTGIVSSIVASLGGERQNFLVDKGIFRYILVLSEVWKESGWSTIIYMAAIAGIDVSLYEAATIDGANRLKRMLHITWPGIQTMAVALLIISFGHIMEAGFQQIFNLYNPTVYEVADILDTYVYRITFQRTPNFGFGTAVGLFKGIISFVFLLGVNGVAKKLGHKGII